MNQADRWLLPDGIEELLPPQASQLESLRRTALDTFHHWGYELVIPPQLEYLESLLTGVGHDLELQTFKVTDQLTGRMMGVSADITPQVARIDAHSWPRPGVSRFCYCGPVLHTRAASLLSSRTPLQIGAEIYGEAGPAADIEVLSLLIESLLSAGMDKIHLDMGHVGIYRALVAAANLSPEAEAGLFESLNNKAVTEFELLVSQHVTDQKLQQAFLQLMKLNGSIEVLEQAGQLQEVADIAAPLKNLAEICGAIQARYPQVDIFLDLAELRGFDYHTGIVFAAYVQGHGQAVAQGGRYDETGAVFGRARPATGFSGDLRQWGKLATSTAQKVESIFAPADADASLWQSVQSLRSEGKRVVCALSSEDTAAAQGCTSELVKQNNQWIVQPL